MVLWSRYFLMVLSGFIIVVLCFLSIWGGACTFMPCRVGEIVGPCQQILVCCESLCSFYHASWISSTYVFAKKNPIFKEQFIYIELSFNSDYPFYVQATNICRVLMLYVGFGNERNESYEKSHFVHVALFFLINCVPGCIYFLISKILTFSFIKMKSFEI